MESYSNNDAGMRVAADLELGEIHITLKRDEGLPDDIIQLVKDYWSMNEAGGWKHKVKGLAESVGVSSAQLTGFLRDNVGMAATYRAPGCICPGCGEGMTISSRSDYQVLVVDRMPGWHLNEEGVCPSCATVAGNEGEGSRLDHEFHDAGITCWISRIDKPLSDEDIYLAMDYWARNARGDFIYKVGLLAERVGVPANKLVEYLGEELYMSAKYLTDNHKCHDCGGAIYLRTRNDYTGLLKQFSRKGAPPVKCAGCQRLEEEMAAKATWEKKEAYAKTPEAKRDRIRKNWSNPADPVEFDTLSLSQIATLLTLTLAYGTPNGEHFDYKDARLRFSPTETLDIELVRELFRARGVRVDHEASGLEDFTDDGESVYVVQAKLRPNVSLDGKLLKIAELKAFLLAYFEHGGWESHWTDQLKRLWLRLAVEECIEFTQERAENYDLEMPPLERHRSQIELLLEKFSVSECFYFIGAAYLTASGFLNSQQCKGRPHAMNTIPGRIEKLSMQPRQQIKRFERTNAVPRSLLSEVLFDRMLGKSNDTGFRLSPGEYAGTLLMERTVSDDNFEEDIGVINEMSPLPWKDEALASGDWYGMLPDREALVAWARQTDNQDIGVLVEYALHLRDLVEELRQQLPPGTIEKLVKKGGGN